MRSRFLSLSAGVFDFSVRRVCLGFVVRLSLIAQLKGEDQMSVVTLVLCSVYPK